MLMHIKLIMRYKGKLTRGMHRWAKVCKNNGLEWKVKQILGGDSKEKTLQLWHNLHKKYWIQKTEYFALGKAQGPINGRNRCRLMVGRNSRHYS
jgi:hypothetical protein